MYYVCVYANLCIHAWIEIEVSPSKRFTSGILSFTLCVFFLRILYSLRIFVIRARTGELYK